MDYNTTIASRINLLSQLREFGGQRPLARHLNCDHKAIKYWMDKYQISVKDYEDYEKDIKKTKEFSVKAKNRSKNSDYYLEENGKYSYEKIDDTYIFYAPFGEFDIEQEVLDEILLDYCEIGLTKKDTALDIVEKYNVDISIREVHVVLQAYGVIHASMPYRKEVIEKSNPKDLAKLSINRKEQLYYKTVKEEEYKKAIRENRKYKQEEYLFEKHINKVLNELDRIDYRPPHFEIKTDRDQKVTLVVNISDWHKGKLVLNSKILGKNAYNKIVFKQRMNMYLRDIIAYIQLYKPERVLILNYGDGPDDPSHQTYPGQREQQDLIHEEQLVQYIVDLKDFVLGIYNYCPNLKYTGVPGNHSKGNVNWDALANKMLEQLLENYDIEMDVDNTEFKIHQIYDYYLVQYHGNQMTSKVDTPAAERQALGIIELEGLPRKKTVLAQGHLHHRASEGPNYRRILLPSMVGGDTLSSNLMQTGARPAQQTFLFTEGVGLNKDLYTFFDLEA